MKNNSDQDVASKIKQFEKKFKHLHRSIRTELKSKEDITIEELLQALTLLPVNLRNEYQEVISSKLPSLPREGSISELFLHLNPLFSFLDYGLLQYIIEEFGSTSLKVEMESYCCDIHVFMNQTTVQQLIDYWPHENEITPNVSKVIAKINKDPRSVKLSELDSLRREICIRAKLSDVICALVSARPSESFIVVWRLPSVLAPNVIKAIRNTEQSFFVEKSINSLFVGDLQVYSFHIVTFGSVLKQRYQVVPITVSHAEWIVSPTQKIFRLAMIEKEKVQRGNIKDEFVQMTISGKIDDILCLKTPVKLENIFKGLNKQVILIEGAPGSGKSTLTIHICQKWGIGKLFEQFDAVILVQLRDPAVQRAQTIADLLPIENVAVAQKLAAELLATNGYGVLFVLDGWDELPTHLQQYSIFRKLLPTKQNSIFELELDLSEPKKNSLLNECSVIVTSRPISSGDLHPVVSSRIEVLGFTPEEQRRYFTECLKGDTKALETLLEKILENPVIQSSCYLPLNAALTVYYFKIKDHSLPSTEYEIFSTIILHCIRRHYEREGRGHTLPVELESLDDLSRSEAVREPFECLCELAYHGVMENKVTFSSSDLPQGSNTLSLLQAIESFLQSGKSVFYNFFHLSLQELLAGYYIATCLPDHKQVSQFQQLFHQPRFISVFQFFAAITKLKTPGIIKVITEIITRKSKPHLVSLLRCLYEAQDPSLCQFVAEQLNMFDLSNTSLSILDSISIGYFFSMSSADTIMTILLQNCQLNDCFVKNLTKYMCMNGADALCKWCFDMKNNNIHKDGVASITKVLGTVNSLGLSFNPIGDKGLKYLSEALITNSSLVELDVSSCSLKISEENGPVVTEMLQRNRTLRKLSLCGNPGISDTGIFFIAEGLKMNSAFKELAMSNITAPGGKALATAILTNTSLPLIELHLFDIGITDDSGPIFVDMIQQNTSLEILTISNSFGVSDYGVFCIAQGLQRNTILKVMNLIDCNFTSIGAKDLSRMLTVNHSLTSLDISRNPIGDKGIAHLADVLKQNETLEKLSVKSCQISDAGVSSLADTVRKHYSFIQINLEGNGLTKDGVARSMKRLSRTIHLSLPQHLMGIQTQFESSKGVDLSTNLSSEYSLP